MSKYYKLFTPSICQMCGADLKTQSQVIGYRLGCAQEINPFNKRSLATTICRCKSCGLIYADPMPLPLDIQEHYSAESGDDYHGFPEWNTNWFYTEIKTFNTLYEKNGKKIKALDVGCGTGHTVKSLLLAGFDAYGLEPSDVFFKEIITDFPEIKDHIKQATIEDADLEAASFEFITFGAVLEHLPYPGEALTKASNLLSPGGLIHLEIPNAKWIISDIIDLFYKIIGARLTTKTSPLHSPYHLYEFTEKSFDEFARRNNLEVKICKSFVSSIPHFPGFSKPFLRFLMKITKRYMQLSVWLKKPKNQK